MKVKGTVLSSSRSFVKENFSNRYKDWLNGLPVKSREILANPIMASEWYDVEDGLIEPTRSVAMMFYNGDVSKAAWEMGRHSAEVGLTGIYKVFVLIATPQFMIKRGGKILSSFYQPSVLSTGNERPKGVDVVIAEFGRSSEITECRIGGWMEKALEICRVKNISVDKRKSLARGDDQTIYVVNWE